LEKTPTFIAKEKTEKKPPLYEKGREEGASCEKGSAMVAKDKTNVRLSNKDTKAAHRVLVGEGKLGVALSK